MKPTALLVNTARGGLVDESALVQALATGRIAGVGLDTYAVEPLPVGHPLRALPNTVLTPHIGYVVKDNFRMYYRDAVEDILAWLAGTPIRVLKPDPG
jgi:phosphoglycerate dehydrogenase-like enzyme